jgi:L-ascorbate metabolism protein UlaG (beta-lactamase superfamily)
MKKIIILSIIVQLFIVEFLNAQKTINANITYIGNEGFMISNNNTKVFIDALYYYSYGGGILNVNSTVRSMMMNNQEPFANSSLFMVTHNHPDHYDAAMMKTFLENNPSAKFVSTNEITGALKSGTLESQLVSANPSVKQHVDTTVNHIQLTVYNLLHDVGYRIYNVGFVANIDGLTIFHSGDNTMEDTTEFVNYKINEKQIDIAFISYGAFQNAAQRAIIMKYVNPKYIVLMHVPTHSVNSTKSMVASIQSQYPPIIVFNTSMESVHIDNAVKQVNTMPQKMATINDTTLTVNDPVNIRLSNIFKDNDLNDSVTYSIQNLPSGLDFDSTQMLITGKITKAGVYNLTVCGCDKHLCSNNLTFKIEVKEEEKTAINAEVFGSVEIYPNPCTNVLNIKGLPSEKCSLSIFNFGGLPIKTIDNQSITSNIDVSGFCSGIYLVKIRCSKGEFASKFLIANK